MRSIWFMIAYPCAFPPARTSRMWNTAGVSGPMLSLTFGCIGGYYRRWLVVANGKVSGAADGVRAAEPTPVPLSLRRLDPPAASGLMKSGRRLMKMALKVSDVARLAGVSIRTLHHYDEIGLLRPSERSP